jgi:hypothetical protein
MHRIFEEAERQTIHHDGVGYRSCYVAFWQPSVTRVGLYACILTLTIVTSLRTEAAPGFQDMQGSTFFLLSPPPLGPYSPP